jgi:cupin fold WbuC family metalloprotein
MKILDEKILDGLSAAARENPRRRMNLNLHEDYGDPCQRLLNAVEPTSYVRPHRHLTPPKPETFLAVRGRFAVVLFADDGAILQVAFLSPGREVVADIQAGAWHAVVSLEPGSVFFEAKPGPYEPLSDKDWAPWAPAEGSGEAEGYLEKLREAILNFEF